jgi:predicted phage terminase large subunit-like protein
MSAVLAPPTQTLSEAELRYLYQNLHTLSRTEQEEILKIAEELERRRHAERCRNDLIAFCKHMQADYKVGKHHRILANLLMEIAEGKKDRICVNIPPRHGKSQLVSIYFPAWFLGKHPDKKVLMVSHTTDLAVDFGRKVRNIIDSAAYKDIFPTVSLASDSKSAGRWNTGVGGEYYACGVGSALAGRGADLLLVDDPHSEQDLLNGNFEAFDKAYEWFTYGARTRLMPGGRVAIIQTRWHMDDLTGRVTRDMGKNEFADQYEVVEFPALFEVEDPETEKTVQKALWPEFFDVDALLRTKASMPVFQWNSQYQQQPTAEEGAIVKREWWKIWEAEKPPECEYIIMTLDAAAEKTNRADFTAITTWGVFFHEKDNNNQIILLNAIKDRVEFPELKVMAQEEYNYWKPDAFIVEKKSNGAPLYQELRRTSMIIQEYTPHRGSGDKFARLNSVADIIKSGLVWVPQTRWAEELVEEVAGFPFMSNDDLVDTTVMALMRFRQGGFLRLATDELEPKKQFKSRRGGASKYY